MQKRFTLVLVTLSAAVGVSFISPRLTPAATTTTPSQSYTFVQVEVTNPCKELKVFGYTEKDNNLGGSERLVKAGEVRTFSMPKGFYLKCQKKGSRLYTVLGQVTKEGQKFTCGCD